MPENDDVLLTAQSLQLSYAARGGSGGERTQALKDVSVTVRRGQRVGIVGESGSGKSTLGNVLAGLKKPDSGTVMFDGIDLSTLSEKSSRRLRPRLQYVLQDPSTSLNPRMTVQDLIAEGLRVHTDLPATGVEERVAGVMGDMRLPMELATRRPSQLSGGQRQRVSVARSLVLEPELVILDEPVSALDMSVQAQLLNMLLDAQEKENLTYVFIVHDLRVARWFCDRILVMYQGEVVEEASNASFFDNPEHPYSVELLSAVPGA